MLENGPDFDRELLPALFLVALPKPDPSLALTLPVPALQLGRLPDGPAMRANRPIRPKGRFEVFKGRRFAMEGQFREF